MAAPGAQPTITEGVANQTEDLSRVISARLLYFYVLGDVLGSGIYALIGVMAGQVGGAFWTSFSVGVSAAVLTGFGYAALIAKYPQAAGATLLVCLLMLAVGLGLYFANSLAQRRLDPSHGRGGGGGGS